MSLKFHGETDSSWSELTKAASTTNWIMWHVENKEVKVHSTGTGGLSELRGKFAEDSVYFGCFKVSAVDDRENTVSIRTKYIAFTCIGTKVGVMKKANAGPQRNEIFAKFKGTALFIDVSNGEELGNKNVMERLLASGGAHKPTRYEFGDGTSEPVPDTQNQSAPGKKE